MSNQAYLLLRLAKESESSFDRTDYLFECAHILRLCLDTNKNIKDAQFLMGYLYERGLSVELDLKLAFDHFKAAADLGHCKANTKLGHMYYSGIREQTLTNTEDEMLSTANSFDDEINFLVEPDQELALKKYLRAGQKGDSEAYNCAGLIMEKENAALAVEYYQQAMSLDESNTDALFNMALLYYSKKEE